MSSRALGVLLIVSSAASAFAAGMMTGCSEDEPAGPGDAGSDGSRPDANRPAPTEPDARPKTCREQCEEAHPTGLPKDEAVNSCWETHCNVPCIEQLPGDGGIDGAAPDGAACESPVVTVSVACDECTNAFCCGAWDGCFQEPECAALNACYQQCTDD